MQANCITRTACVGVCVCVRACVHACVRACVRACVLNITWPKSWTRQNQNLTQEHDILILQGSDGYSFVCVYCTTFYKAGSEPYQRFEDYDSMAYNF
jgi:hypothetical protein